MLSQILSWGVHMQKLHTKTEFLLENRFAMTLSI